ncbi:MAG: chromosome segregation protein SMC [Hymenobacteraceae bacterium]|nr:chromosome segregation protein SMC [Hymenobacteraceae bacterium]
MQVSRLEIKGFKSFGDRVVLNFDRGITGIVGPNGCGKSNIVDAIRWVLGEQKTRNLRSDKMENVIFNGSKNRKPLQLAEVSLTFNNNRGILPTEYSEVTVTRKYYRSGDSEYLLNNVPCRLKDINDLFLDTGIGSDSYAIIELKMVDEILNDKDNSRRNLFEEAAGISKFKVRKKQTLRKLEETDADLARVEDLLFEIGKNLKSLERQAKQAEKYLALKDEYKRYSIEFARRSIEQHQQALERLEAEHKNVSEQKGDFAGQLDELENALTVQKQLLEETQEKLSVSQRSMGEQTGKIRQLENEIKLKSERVLFLQERIRSVRQQIVQDKAQVEHSRESIVELEENAEALQVQFEQSEEQVSQLKQELAVAQEQKAVIQKSHHELNNQLKAKQNLVFQLNKDIEISQIQVTNLQLELERLSQQDQSAEENTRQFESDLQEAQEMMEEKTSELVNLQAKEAQLKEEIEQTELEIQDQRIALIELNRTLDAKRNEYKLTKSLVENLEGFPEAIRFLHSSDSWKPAPLLSDIIVCDQEYKGLIESYLEPYMNFFVVETVEDALEAIRLLNNQNKGRANFIILSEIEDLAADATYSDGKNKAAMEVVQADEKYHHLLRYILNEVYISHESELSYYNGDHRTLILRDGSVIKKPLSISGGSVGVFDGNRLGRKQNLETLALEIEAMAEETELLQSKINTKQQILLNLKNSSHQEEIKRVEKEVAAHNQQLMSIRIRHEQHLLNQKNHLSKRDELMDRMAELREKVQELQPAAEQEQQELHELEQNIASFAEQLNEQNEAMAEVTGIFNRENIKFHEYKNRLSSLQQEIAYKQKTVETNQQRLEGLQEELEKSEQEIVTAENFIEESQEKLELLNAERQDLSAVLEEVEKEYFTLRGELETKDKTIRELQRRRQNTDEIIMGIQQKISEIHIKLVSVKERLSAEFNISDEDLATVAEPLDVAWEELTQQIAASKQKLDSMGNVNLMAAEAYAEIDERNTFIRTQRDDLLQAKQNLLDTIMEIDTVAKEQFFNAYTQIKHNFVRVFQSLFSEDDTCDLILSDPQNPLESKVEIIARPKGKRPLTINQLSGGEKTLTAISLLFAIYLLKPAPFCIFDEVDAPLDDANIDKFNNIIRDFSNESQFIIVTHNKRTMTSTDIIYGITMHEPGVSRVIPVDLRQIA